MKILILNTAEHTGGAAVAANRLLRALLRSGVSATMLVRDRATDDPAVVSLDRGAVRRWLNFLYFVWERLVIYLCNRLSKRNLFQVSIANTIKASCRWMRSPGSSLPGNGWFGRCTTCGRRRRSVIIRVIA